MEKSASPASREGTTREEKITIKKKKLHCLGRGVPFGGGVG